MGKSVFRDSFIRAISPALFALKAFSHIRDLRTLATSPPPADRVKLASIPEWEWKRILAEGRAALLYLALEKS